jgi:hypothetical protein
MSEETAPRGLDYPAMVAAALKGVLREVLRRVAEEGFPGEHHLYVSFRTDAPHVGLPARLRQEFPQEMTIVLQNQFWGLAVDEGAFSVQLRFGGVPERLTIPWDAIIAFADPSVPFGLRFEASNEEAVPVPADQEAPRPSAKAEAAGASGDAKVVAFKAPGKNARTGPRRPRRS